MKISVIVPVYKVEKYIEKCIQSLLDQTYTNFEALIVDDGSPDQSISIAKKLVGNDPRFIFLEKENGGSSSARNYGLDHMTGNYVYFLDSDDYIAKETFEKCMAIFKEDISTDIVIFGTNWITTSGKIIKQTISNINKYYDEEDILLINDSIEHMAWNKIYKKSIFDKVRFSEGIIYEDTDLMYKLIYQKKIYLLKEYLYFYIQREGSIMSTFDISLFKSLVNLYNGYQLFLKDKKIDNNKIINDLDKYYYKLLVFHPILNVVKNSKNYRKDAQDIKKIFNKYKLKLADIRKYYPIYSKQYLGILLFKTSPFFFKKIYLLTNIK